MAEGAITTGYVQHSVGNVSVPEATNGSVGFETIAFPQPEVAVLSASGEESHSANTSSSPPNWGLLPPLNDSSVFSTDAIRSGDTVLHV
ncbi:hypothetical protein MTO96_042760 [Rhipicephalus appendiculatus]